MSSARVKPFGAGPAGSDPAPRKSRRAVQAEQTRRDILDAARRRFAAQGYAATTVKDVAEDAGVSVQTVYDSVGGKPELVRQLNDLIDSEAGIGEIAAAIREGDPAVVVRIPARISGRLVERCGDILRAALTGSYSEPELTSTVEEGQRRHRAGAAAVAQRLASLGALRPGLSVEAAGITLAVLGDFRLALLLVDEFQMDGDALEEWIATTTAQSILKSRR